MKRHWLAGTAMARVLHHVCWLELFIQGFMSQRQELNPGVLRWLVRYWRAGGALTYDILDEESALCVATRPGYQPTRVYVHLPLALLRSTDAPAG